MFNTPQENANRAWEKLGKKMGFDYMTVRPNQARGALYFTAVPTETPAQRDIRLHSEKEARRLLAVEAIKQNIAELQKQLDELTDGGRRP